MFINGGILLLFVSICLVHQAFSTMYLSLLNQLNDIDDNCSRRELLCKLVRFAVASKRKFLYYLEHTIKFYRIFSPNIFRWFFNSADVYSLMILVHSFCSILFLTCIIFQFDLVSEVGQNLNISILNVEFIFSKSSTLITPYLRLSMRLWSAFWIFMHVAISVKWQSKATWKWAMV